MTNRSPASYVRINFKGILDFPLDRYAGRLIIDAPAIAVLLLKIGKVPADSLGLYPGSRSCTGLE